MYKKERQYEETLINLLQENRDKYKKYSEEWIRLIRR